MINETLFAVYRPAIWLTAHMLAWNRGDKNGDDVSPKYEFTDDECDWPVINIIRARLAIWFSPISIPLPQIEKHYTPNLICPQ